MNLSPPIPIIRIFCEKKAKEFYLDFLGFTLDWEHRFDDNSPLYAQVKRGELVLHLSEHHGDATPGSTSYVPLDGIAELHAELSGKNYTYNKPSIHVVPWGRTMEVTDPFGNRFRFCETNDD